MREEGEELEDEEEEASPSYYHHHTSSTPTRQTLVADVASRLINGSDLSTRVQAAREIRKIVRNCSNSSSTSPAAAAAATRIRNGFVDAGVIEPLIDMMGRGGCNSNVDAKEAALLALLNLAVRNFKNKVKIVSSGAIPPLLELLKFHGHSLRELAAAAILTLSAAEPNKAIIVESGVCPFLVQILNSGSVQGRVDAVTTLHYLSSCTECSIPILDSRAAAPLINLLKDSKKYSKFAEKTTALLEILLKYEEGQIVISNMDGGILTLVETVEDGSLRSTEHAVGALLALCQSSRDKYRKLILNEGAIPGLLKLTADGTPEAQGRARTLLDLLRESPKEKRMASSVLEKIVYDIAKRVDGEDKAAETAKKLLQDMAQRSMEVSMNRVQDRAASFTASNCSSL